MVDNQYLKEYLKEQNSFIKQNFDKFDFLSEDDMFFEKGVIATVMKNMEKNGVHHQEYNYTLISNMGLTKSSILSRQKRLAGNVLFNKISHNESIHRSVFALYTESIAAAPKESEELVLSYSNRATLLMHLNRYKECLDDCERAMSSVKSDQMKVKLMLRKTEALIGLKDYSKAKDTLSEANCLLKKTNIIPKLDAMLKKKSQDFVNVLDNVSVENIKNAEEKFTLADELPLFKANTEVPSASEAVAIKYNKEWGRHIVATRCIKPGEILVREKSYFSFVDPSEMYFFCSFCTKPSWNLMPCDGCIFNVYCSDKCCLEANEKYHKFECPILPYICEKDNDSLDLFCHLRFLLTAVHNAGSLKHLKEEQIAAQRSKDPRKKGFMEDDIFHSDELRSCLSLNTKAGDKNVYFESSFGINVCYVVYHLATKTDFFGKTYDIKPLQMMSEPNMLFFTALMFRQILSWNSFQLKYYHPNGIAHPMGISLHPFCSLFNNSCNSNTDLIFTENNEIIIYANQCIEKESQVFINYYQRDILLVPKDERKKDYEIFMKFTCKCIPCIENWSHVCLPLLKDLLETSSDSLSSIELLMKNIEKQVTQHFVYKQDLINEVTNAMKLIAEKATVNCAEYRQLEKIMKRIFMESFGKKPLVFSASC